MDAHVIAPELKPLGTGAHVDYAADGMQKEISLRTNLQHASVTMYIFAPLIPFPTPCLPPADAKPVAPSSQDVPTDGGAIIHEDTGRIREYAHIRGPSLLLQ